MEMMPHFMDEEPLSTREKLLRAGTEEFYKRGYRQASLRRICAACGVTTGAFYILFPSKDSLLCAIVDPVIEKLFALTEEVAAREREDPSTGQDCDRRIMEFELAHRKELLILMEKAEGSSRECYKDMAYAQFTKQFVDFFAHVLRREPNPEIIDLIVSMRFQGNMKILKGEYSMEQALFLSDVLACYADGGYESLMKNLKDVL